MRNWILNFFEKNRQNERSSCVPWLQTKFHKFFPYFFFQKFDFFYIFVSKSYFAIFFKIQFLQIFLNLHNMSKKTPKNFEYSSIFFYVAFFNSISDKNRDFWQENLIIWNGKYLKYLFWRKNSNLSKLRILSKLNIWEF